MPTILIADDDPQIVTMLRMTLQYEGFSVVVAQNGEAALREARRARPDLIILDWLMPQRSGVEVAETLQAEGAPPILMLTARDLQQPAASRRPSGRAVRQVSRWLQPEQCCAPFMAF